MPIDRKPWTSALKIEVPTSLEACDSMIDQKQEPGRSKSRGSLTTHDDAYICMLVYRRIAKHMVWKRLTGSVKEYIIFETPLL
jgi:hypothetical protein